MKTKADAVARAWRREWDALISERAEGLEVIVINEEGHNNEPLTPSLVKNGLVPVPHYNTDLAAIARAMEAWRGQEPDYRAWAIESHEGQIDAECRDWEKRYRGHSENGDIPKACAAALLRAIGGGE